ncbi:MAG: branched-chain amino acid ABC transporter permease, partial [Pseudomonadota bacterium]
MFLPTFYIYLITEILIVSLFAVSTNVLLGFTGLLSFGQVAFFGSSAYAVSLLIKGTSLPFAASFFISVGISALAALIIGLFCMRLRGFYFAILTLAFSQIFFVVAYK